MTQTANAKTKETFFSYSSDSPSKAKKLAIKAIEVVTGYRKLEKMYLEALEDMDHDESFWSAAVRALQVSASVHEERLKQIPKSGPCVIVANHPFGVLDGVILNHLVSQRRDDGKILINAVLGQMRGFSKSVLPVDFSRTEQARATNRNSRERAMQHVCDGGALLVFPAGGVSTSQGFFGSAIDAPWRTFTAEVVQKAEATVVPVYFGGQNSRLFQVVSQVSTTLRVALYIREVLNKTKHHLPVVIGDAMPFSELESFSDPAKLIQYLRHETYSLARALPTDLHKPRKIAA